MGTIIPHPITFLEAFITKVKSLLQLHLPSNICDMFIMHYDINPKEHPEELSIAPTTKPPERTETSKKLSIVLNLVQVRILCPVDVEKKDSFGIVNALNFNTKIEKKGPSILFQALGENLEIH